MSASEGRERVHCGLCFSQASDTLRLCAVRRAGCPATQQMHGSPCQPRALLLLLLLQVAKVSDFGVSAKLMDGATHRSTTSLGTITHMAPEGKCLFVIKCWCTAP